MTADHLTLGPGDDLAAAVAGLPEGGVVGLRPGRYIGSLQIQRSLTLRGLGDADAVTLDADDAGACLSVIADDVELHVEGLTLTGGNAEGGGAIGLFAMASATLVDCLLTGNRSRQVPGGAVYLDQGSLALRRCQVAANSADDAPAVCADGIATLIVHDSLIRGEVGLSDSVVRVRDGALATFSRTTLIASGQGAALHASGTTTRAPEVTVSDCILDGPTAIDAPPPFGASVRTARSVLSSTPATPVEDLGGTVVGDPLLDESAIPGPNSPALGVAEGADATDLRGRPRPDQAAAGALEP